jgi:hypothetical protein
LQITPAGTKLGSSFTNAKLKAVQNKMSKENVMVILSINYIFEGSFKSVLKQNLLEIAFVYEIDKHWLNTG